MHDIIIEIRRVTRKERVSEEAITTKNIMHF